MRARKGHKTARKALGLLAGVSGLWTLAPGALAQTAVETAQEEIVVTATKRGDALAQDVPLAMTAFSSDQLEALNFETLQSLTYTMPNVQLEDVGTIPGIANFSIRGLGVNSSIPSVDPTVGVFVDGMYLGINAGVVTDNFDLEAVEVLRGPQGTLYGRNVTGGAVLLRTRAPTDELEIRARAALETGLQQTYDASISGPLIDNLLSAKLAYYYSDDEGWFTNDFDGSQFGASEQNILRAALRLTPGENFEATLRYEDGETEGDGPAGQNHALFGRNTFDFAINNPGFANSDWRQLIGEFNWDVDFGDGRITGIAGWREYNLLGSSDIDASPVFGFHARALTQQEQTSGELRYAGTFGPVGVTAGVYSFQQDLLYIEERALAGGLIFRVGGGEGDFSSWGAFLSTDWALNDELTLNLGVRYSEEQKQAVVSRIRSATDPLDGANVIPGEGVIGGNINTATLTPSDAPFDLEWNDVSPRIGLQWQPNPDTNLYAFWARGFRSGGVNFRVTTFGNALISGAPVPFDAEEQSSFEIGWKQDYFDQRLRVNLAAYHNTIEGMQRETNFADPVAGVQQIILNAGDATLQGFEAEVRWAASDNLLLSGFVGYTDASYDSVTGDLNGDGLVNAADASLEIPRVAPWSYGVSVLHDLPISGWGMLTSRVSYNHRDASFFTDNNLGRLAESDVVDLNLTLAPNNGPWSFSIYGNNLTNDVSFGGVTPLPDSPLFGGDGPGGVLGPPLAAPLNEGRVWGAELRLRF